MALTSYEIRKAELKDCEDIVGLIKELAEYESMPDQVDMTVETLQTDAFCSHPFVYFLVVKCRRTGKTVGYSSFSYTYSTWKGRTLYLDDLYVTPAHRGAGIGTSLMQAVAKYAIENNCTRMNWIVLEWNSRPKELYSRIGGKNLTERDGWQNMTLFRDELHAFATAYRVNTKEDTSIAVDLGVAQNITA